MVDRSSPSTGVDASAIEASAVDPSMIDRPAPLWRTMISSRIRSQLAYRTSFWLNATNSFLTGFLEYFELYILLGVAPVYGGMTLPQVTLVFALSGIAFSLADLIFGQMDSLPTFIRQGQLEGFLIRPLPLMPQLITSSFQLRRLARVSFGIIALIWSLTALEIDWQPWQVIALIMTPVFGTVIFSATFVLAGGLQFWLVNGPEFTNAFVYGGRYVSQLPATVLFAPLRVFFTFVIPTVVTAYLPVAMILGLPTPIDLPSWLAWFAPVFAIGIWTLALLTWRAGVHKYTGAGG